MPRRPPSSSGSSRPFTSSGLDRPSTARPPSSAAAGYYYPNHEQQFAYVQDQIEEEDEEESEDEDVFAFGPPTTADQQQQQQQQLQQQQQEQVLHENQSQTVHAQPPLVQQEFPYPISPPPPVFDPHSQSNNPYLKSPTASTIPRPPYVNSYVDTPPSTDSQADHDDPYQMRRLKSDQTSPTVSVFPPPPSANSHNLSSPLTLTSTRRVDHVDLPPSQDGLGAGIGMAYGGEEGEKRRTGNSDMRTEGTSTLYDKQRPTSMDSGSVSVTPSMLEYMGDSDSRPGSIKMGFDFDAIEEEDSPYPEVRASVSNIDDPEMPALTLRMWIIGLFLCMTASAANVFFNFRQPAPTVIPLVLLLLSYPMGKFAAFTLPIRTYRLFPRWFISAVSKIPGANTLARFPPFSLFVGNVDFSINPGPWNIKEHVLVYIMANVAVGPPYALNAIVVSEIFYKIKLGFWFNLVLVLATQLTGFGLAGLCRRFLVWPASMVWPQNLVACTLLNTLHAEDDESTGGITRFKYYIIGTAAAFFFFFLPGYLFQALSVFSFICWAAPKNVPVNQLFGINSGLGMSVLTFDWTQISWIGSPLMVPWWAQVHVFVGFVVFYWILTPILYYSNVWQLAHFPISDNEPYDRFGNRYNVTRILSPNNTFNLTAYEEYSPLFLPATYAMTYLLAFALSTCVIVHTLLYHGKKLLNGFKKISVEKDDIHAKLMKNYPEVPDWWYLASFTVFFCLAIVAVERWGTGVPVWALCLAVLLPIIYVLPSGFIFAMTGQAITLNLLAQIIPGTLLPGNPLANMVFKAYSVQTLTEATMFVQDLKLGHYVKVPPRATFLVQLLATILAAFVQVGTKHWMFANIPDMCQEHQRSSLTCPHNQVFFTASAIWGLIGPTRQFGSGAIYHPQLYAIIIGALLPLPFWLWQRRHPNSSMKLISTPIVLNGVAFIPPATGINYSSWLAVGFIFQYWIRNRNFAWWSRFNYVTSAALDSGTVLSLIVIFFTLQFPRGGGVKVDWWGNNVFKNTADWNLTPLRSTPPGGL